MTTDDPRPQDPNAVPSTWWTPRRTKFAGLVTLFGGVGGLLVSLSGLGLVGFPLGNSAVEITPGIVIILYPVLHVLMAVGVLAVDALYDHQGRIVATLLVLSLVGEAGSIITLMVGGADLGELFLPIGVVHATLYMAIRLFGSIYGVTLWRHIRVNRITAGLFIVLFPAIFVLAPLTQIGFPGQLIGAPLDVAFIALGLELWADPLDASPRTTEVTE